MDWTETYFDEDYFHIYKHLTPERAELEVEFLTKFVFDKGTERILDIPCGYGRHTTLLALRGYTVHGVDNSETMLSAAKSSREKQAESVKERLSYEHGDMRHYKNSIKFDAALSLFSSFGYFTSDAENESVLSTLCSHVRDGGIVVLDVRNPERDLEEFAVDGWERVERRGEFEIAQRLDPESLKHTLIYRYEKGGIEKEKAATWQHYLLPDLKNMFSKYGCIVERVFGNYKGEEYEPDSRRMIVVAKKEGSS